VLSLKEDGAVCMSNISLRSFLQQLFMQVMPSYSGSAVQYYAKFAICHSRSPIPQPTSTTILMQCEKQCQYAALSLTITTRNPAIAEGPRDAGVPVEIW